jgi:hypothetical protein
MTENSEGMMKDISPELEAFMKVLEEQILPQALANAKVIQELGKRLDNHEARVSKFCDLVARVKELAIPLLQKGVTARFEGHEPATVPFETVKGLVECAYLWGLNSTLRALVHHDLTDLEAVAAEGISFPELPDGEFEAELDRALHGEEPIGYA